MGTSTSAEPDQIENAVAIQVNLVALQIALAAR